MSRVLITGIAGLSGRHLGRYLIELGLDVYGLDNAAVDFDRDLSSRLCKYQHVDVRDRELVAEAINDAAPDYLFHLAGIMASDSIEELLAANVMGTRNVLDAVDPAKTRVLIPGSAAEYGAMPDDLKPLAENAGLQPVNNYGISKACQTLLACSYYHRRGCPVFIARTFNIIGPSALLVCAVIARQVAGIKSGRQDPVIRLGNLDRIRDFVDIDDVVRAYWLVINQGRAGEIYNVCSGKGRRIGEIVDIFLNIANVKANVESDTRRCKRAEISVSIGDNKKIREQLGWSQEKELAESLAGLLEYYCHNSN